MYFVYIFCVNVSELDSTPDSLLAKVWYYVPLNKVHQGNEIIGAEIS